VYAYSLNGSAIWARADNNPAVIAYSSNDYAGFFEGNVYCSGVYVGSDQNLKQNIHDFTSAMDIINKLKPKQYEFRQDGNYTLMNLPNGEHCGLIAQDVEKVLPNLVKDTKFETRYTKSNNADKKKF